MLLLFPARKLSPLCMVGWECRIFGNILLLLFAFVFLDGGRGSGVPVVSAARDGISACCHVEQHFGARSVPVTCEQRYEGDLSCCYNTFSALLRHGYGEYYRLCPSVSPSACRVGHVEACTCYGFHRRGFLEHKADCTALYRVNSMSLERGDLYSSVHRLAQNSSYIKACLFVDLILLCALPLSDFLLAHIRGQW